MTAMTRASRFSLLIVGLANLAALAAGPARAEDDPWPSIRQEVFGSRDIAENDGIVTLFGPERAEDAAIVPISVRFPASTVGTIAAMTLIIDRNPGAGRRHVQVRRRLPQQRQCRRAQLRDTRAHR